MLWPKCQSTILNIMNVFYSFMLRIFNFSSAIEHGAKARDSFQGLTQIYYILIRPPIKTAKRQNERNPTTLEVH